MRVVALVQGPAWNKNVIPLLMMTDYFNEVKLGAQRCSLRPLSVYEYL
jgi:hypothetical protein